MSRLHFWILIVTLVAAALLRFTGLDWGTDRVTGEFHAFHPDESNVIAGAGQVGVDISEITSPYGKAPMYLLYAVAGVAGKVSGTDPFTLDDNETARFTYRLARGISAALGTLTVLLAFGIGTRLGRPWTGVLGALLLAVCPGHIQQSHYYTVDVSFTFWVALAVFLMLHLPSRRAWIYLICGVACGLAAGTRVAGAWLCFPFLFAHLYPPREPLRARPNFRELRTPRVGLFVLAASAVGLACEPRLLLDPAGFLADQETLSVMGSVQVVKGEVIQIWTLCDFATTRYVHQLTNLLWFGLGPWLEAASLAGVLLVVWLRRRAGFVILAWVIPYFLLVASLHSKPIRYMTPLLPFLAVLGGWVCVVAACRLRSTWPKSLVFALPAALVVSATTAYGLAMVRIYRVEDARIAASRWISGHIPEGAEVLVERGGFPTAWMVPDEVYRPKMDDASYFIISEGNTPYTAQLEFIRRRIGGTEWAVCVAENRIRQYLAVPDRYPVAHGFYRRLVSGDLGFVQVARFKVVPGIPGWDLEESGAEPTITAFDHPEVIVFRSQGKPVGPVLSAWQEEILQDRTLPDTYVQAGVAAYGAHDWGRAEAEFRGAVAVRPSFTLGYLLLREALFRQGRQSAADSVWATLNALHDRGVSVEATLGLIHAGLEAEGVAYLESVLESGESAGSVDRQRAATVAARTRIRLGLKAEADGDLAAGEEQLLRAAEIAPEGSPVHLSAMLNLGRACHQRGELDRAAGLYRRVLEFNKEEAAAHLNLGIIHYARGEYGEASDRFALAAEIDDADWQAHLGVAQSRELEGLPAAAAAAYRRVLELVPGNREAAAGLGRLAEAAR